MPIKIPDNLPARKTLQEEGVDVISEQDAIRQDIRPLRFALLNLMPEKIKTETQITRLLGASPLQIEVTLITTASYTPTNTPREHMLAFYEPFHEIEDQTFDGLIVTGAPVEEMPFEEVQYWDELTQVFDWAETNVFSTFNICWGAQASLYHHYQIPKYSLPQKIAGVFPHRINRRNAGLVRGFNDQFYVPVSRYTEVRGKDVDKHRELEVLIESDKSGICLIHDRVRHDVHIFNHLEYDTWTLSDEYNRDVKARPDTVFVPHHYFPDDNPALTPHNTWRAHGHLLFSNWINLVYQSTPFDLETLGKERRKMGKAKSAKESKAKV